MDRIESVGAPEDRPGNAPTPSPTPPTTTTTSTPNPDAAKTTSSPPTPDPNRLAPTPFPARPGTLSRSRRPSVRIQRLSSVSSLSNDSEDPNRDRQQQQQRRRTGTEGSAVSPFQSRPIRRSATPVNDNDGEEAWQGNRRRSSSEPRPGRWSSPPPINLSRTTTPMVPLTEERSHQSRGATGPSEQEQEQPDKEKVAVRPPPTPTIPRPQTGRLRRTSQAAMSRLSRNRASTVAGPVPKVTDYNGNGQDRNDNDNRTDEYDPEIVNVLDVIDPEVSALSTLTNVQNSLFVPDLFGFVNREPTYTLSPPQAESSPEEEGATTDTSEPHPEPTKLQEPRNDLQQIQPLSSISSVLDAADPRFAILPEESNLEGWTKEDVEELNDHVRHMLHSRRNKFKRAMKGFGQYVSKPLGFFITLYATLITLFGLAWVLFLIGWINVGGKQLYVINIIDNILVALFAIMGDGLAPFRAIDTYHMIFIAHYTHLTWRIRKRRELPSLKNKNDLPVRREIDIDVEWGDTPKDEQYEFSVLSHIQQTRLIHHQAKFSKSHTFYKPHETYTHYAFPHRLFIAIVVVLDFHSCLQIALGSCTWSIDYHKRPFALTTVILCCSIACNISGGVMITIGDRMTRKKDVVERIFRQKLTSEAMKMMLKRKRKEEKRNASLSHTESGPSVLAKQASPYEGA